MTSLKVEAPGGGEETAELTIGEVAQRTGMSVAGLRNWESRYGIPAPQRTGGGRRRYRESDVSLVNEVRRGRDAGLALPAAIEQARAGAGGRRENSMFAGLRRRHPELPVHELDKGLLLALTWAIEDQCCAMAQKPLLVGAFQEQRFYRSARRRWLSLASTSSQTVVFADFDRVAASEEGPAEIPIPEGSPLQREWALVCVSRDLSACVLGWEPPGQEGRPDRLRRFETIWSVDPQVVRRAARIGMDIASGEAPELPFDTAGHLGGPVRPASPDLQQASGLFGRTLDYLARR